MLVAHSRGFSLSIDVLNIVEGKEKDFGRAPGQQNLSGRNKCMVIPAMAAGSIE